LLSADGSLPRARRREHRAAPATHQLKHRSAAWVQEARSGLDQE